jgi:hypothetical protein
MKTDKPSAHDRRRFLLFLLAECCVENESRQWPYRSFNDEERSDTIPETKNPTLGRISLYEIVVNESSLDA